MSLTKATFSMIENAVVNALDYGDIVADCAPFLTTAYAAAVAQNKPLYIPTGVYTIGSTLEWDGPVDVFGDGAEATILRKTSDFNGVEITAGDAVWIRNFTVDGTVGTPSGEGNGIVVHLGNNLRLTNLQCKNNPGNGILINAMSVGYVANVRLQSNGIGTGALSRKDGIQLNEISPGFVRACTFVNINCITNFGNGMYIVDAPYNTLVGLHAEENGFNGLRIDANGTVGTVYLENNTSEDLRFGAGSYGNNISTTYCGDVIDQGANNSWTLALQDGGFNNEIAHIYSPLMNPKVGDSAYASVSGAKFTEASSGTHPELIVQKIQTPTVEAGGAVVTKTVNLLVEAPSSAGATNLAAEFQGPVHNTAIVGASVNTATPVGGNNATGFFMGTDGIQIIWGSGAPTASCARGSLYIRTDNGASTSLYVNRDGATTWAAITSA
jgi:hypothetical protein